MRLFHKTIVTALLAAGSVALADKSEAQGIGLSVGGGRLSGIELSVTGQNLVPVGPGIGIPISSRAESGFSSPERRARFQAYLNRRRQRRETARALLRERSQTPSGAFNPGYALPPDLSIYSFLSTERGFVTGQNLEERLRHQLTN